MRRIDDRELPVSPLISLGLLLVPGRPSWLQMRSPTICAFDAVLADRGRLLPFRLSVFPVLLMRLIKSNNVLFFHFRDGNSLIIVNALQPFTSLNALLKFCRRLLKEPCLQTHYVTNDAAAFAKNI